MYSELKEAIKKGEVILFAGAGVSASLGLPTWSELIGKLAEDLGYDSRIFSGYGDSLALAEYYQIEKKNMTELEQWMKTNWDVSEEKIKKSEVHQALAKLNFPIVYTTNYEHCLEKAFQLEKKKIRRIVEIKDLVGIKSDEIQIVKLHGDMEKKGSLVLAEKDYFNRLNFESPLDIKLRGDMLGKSILFLGYSLTDINIRLLIFKLDQLWLKGSQEGCLRPKLYIFLPNPNPIQEKIFKERGIETIIGEGLDKKESMVNFLNQLGSERE